MFGPDAVPSPEDGGAPSSQDGGVGRAPFNLLWNILLGVVMSVLAAIGAWGALGVKHEFYFVDSEGFGIGMGAPNEARLKLFAEQARILGLNAMVTFAIAGGLLGVGIAVAGASCCGSIVKIIVGAVWGTAWGGCSGYLGSKAFNAIIQYGTQAEAMQSGLAHGAAFAILGAGIGLMYGGFHRDLGTMAQGLIVGAIAGLLGGIGFSAAGVFIPTQSTENMLPTDAMVRLLWLMIPLAFIGLLLPSLIRKK